MKDKELENELKDYQDKRRLPFWSILIALISILHGEFIYRVDGYLLEHSEPYIKCLPESTIGAALLILGTAKLLAIFTNNKRLKKYSIWGLSFVWTGLFLIALTYSFGIGHPNPSWYFYGMVVIGCYRVSRKGDFED